MNLKKDKKRKKRKKDLSPFDHHISSYNLYILRDHLSIYPVADEIFLLSLSPSLLPLP